MTWISMHSEVMATATTKSMNGAASIKLCAATSHPHPHLAAWSSWPWPWAPCTSFGNVFFFRRGPADEAPVRLVSSSAVSDDTPSS